MVIWPIQLVVAAVLKDAPLKEEKTPPLARVFLHGAHDPLLTNGTTERDSPGGRRGIAEDSELLRSCTYHRFKVRRRFFLRSGGVGFFFIRRRRPFLFRRRWHRWIRFGFDFAHGALEY